MKRKMLLILLCGFVCVSLTGCDDLFDNNIGNGNDNDRINVYDEETDEYKETLSEAGLQLSNIEPNENYYRVDIYDETFTFFLEKDTEKDLAEYVYKIFESCKNIAINKKLYTADASFYSNNNAKTELFLPSKQELKEIDENNYQYQFGYYFLDEDITITITSTSSYDKVRNDEIYYPIYTVSISD